MHRVDKILVENGKAIGVRCRDNVFRAPIVVANANAKEVFLELVGRQRISRQEFRRVYKEFEEVSISIHGVSRG